MPGDDTIVNDSAKSTLWIGGGTDLSAIGVERVGNDLVITLRDENKTRLGSVTVRGWYSGAGKKLKEIAFADGVSLTAEEVESWATVTTGWRGRRGTTSTSGFGAVHNP